MAKKKTSKRKSKKKKDTQKMTNLKGKPEEFVETVVSISLIIIGSQFATTGDIVLSKAIMGGLGIAVVKTFLLDKVKKII